MCKCGIARAGDAHSPTRLKGHKPLLIIEIGLVSLGIEEEEFIIVTARESSNIVNHVIIRGANLHLFTMAHV